MQVRATLPVPVATLLFRVSATLAAVGFILAFDKEVLIAKLATWAGRKGFGIYYVFGGPWIGGAIQDLAGIVGLLALAVICLDRGRARFLNRQAHTERGESPKRESPQSS